MFEQSTECEWQAVAAHCSKRSLYRLLRTAVGPELGKVFRSRLGQAGRRSCPRWHTRPFQINLRGEHNEEATNQTLDDCGTYGTRVLDSVCHPGFITSFVCHVRSD